MEREREYEPDLHDEPDEGEAGHEGGEPDAGLQDAYDLGIEDARLAAQDDAELTAAADELEQRFPELADETVQDEVFGLLQRAGIDPASGEGLKFVEEFSQRRFLDRTEDGDRIVATATSGRFRLGR